MSWLLATSFILVLLSATIHLILILFIQREGYLEIFSGIIGQIFLGLLGLRLFLWFLRGKETIAMEDEELVIRKSGTFWLKAEKRIKISSIKDISVHKNLNERNLSDQGAELLTREFSRSMFIFKIQNTGRIKLVFGDNRTYKCLDNLYLNEAEVLVETIKKHIEI